MALSALPGPGVTGRIPVNVATRVRSGRHTSRCVGSAGDGSSYGQEHQVARGRRLPNRPHNAATTAPRTAASHTPFVQLGGVEFVRHTRVADAVHDLLAHVEGHHGGQQRQTRRPGGGRARLAGAEQGNGEDPKSKGVRQRAEEGVVVSPGSDATGQRPGQDRAPSAPTPPPRSCGHACLRRAVRSSALSDRRSLRDHRVSCSDVHSSPPSATAWPASVLPLIGSASITA